MSRLVAAFFCAVLAVCLLPVFVRPPDHRSAERSRAVVVSTRITEAMQKFRKEFGYWPVGTHAEIVRTVRGENDKGIVFLEMPEEKLTEQGEVPDPWGTPYRILIDAKMGRARVHSAGPDGVFASSSGSDDHISHWNAGATGIPGLPF
jgi:hypothetical protein